MDEEDEDEPAVIEGREYGACVGVMELREEAVEGVGEVSSVPPPFTDKCIPFPFRCFDSSASYVLSFEWVWSNVGDSRCDEAKPLNQAEGDDPAA